MTALKSAICRIPHRARKLFPATICKRGKFDGDAWRIFCSSSQKLFRRAAQWKKDKSDTPTKSVSLRNDKCQRLEFVRRSQAANVNPATGRFRSTAIFARPNPPATGQFQNRACAKSFPKTEPSAGKTRTNHRKESSRRDWFWFRSCLQLDSAAHFYFRTVRKKS